MNFEKVIKRQYRVCQNHPGTGKPHDLSDFFPHFRFVTMHRAVFAGWFVRIEFTMVSPVLCICQQAGTIIAQILSPVHFVTIDADHDPDSGFFCP